MTNHKTLSVCRLGVTEVHLYLLSEIGEQGNGVFHNKITSVIKIMKFQIKSATFNILKVAEFPKLALKHGILLNLPI